MKIKLSILIAFLYLGSAFAAGHITKAQKEKTIECLGHYSATAVLPAETIEVKNSEINMTNIFFIMLMLVKIIPKLK